MTHPHPANTSLLYVGAYTARGSKGIYIFGFDETAGALEPLGLAAELPNPTFLCVHPNGRFLYAVSEVREFGDRRNGAIYAFATERDTGALTPLNAQPSGGAGPCHVSIDRTGRLALAANYASGSVVALRVAADGRLGPATATLQHHGHSVHPERQTAPHAHSITPSPDNGFALAADLGIDRILVYRIDPESGRLWANDPPSAPVKPGAGPRHLAFHPNRPFVYVITELDNTVVAFEWDCARGALRERQTISTLPSGFAGVSCASEVQVDAAGRFLYGANRGHDSLAVFRINESSGLLSPVGHTPTQGGHPRHFVMHPSGEWLLVANQDSDSIVVFRRDPVTGQLAATGHSAAVSMPVCLVFRGNPPAFLTP
jgi:6-phosphogluconolactonase